MSTGIKMLENTAVYQLLGADGVEELRSKLVDMIVEEVRDQLRDSSEYIVSPDDISEELYEGIMEEVKQEVAAEYKLKITDCLNKMIDKTLSRFTEVAQ